MPTEKITLEDVNATEIFGQEIAGIVQPGDVILLSGDLGAGKTSLARSIIRALAPAHGDFEVPSPTFTLVQSYDFTRVPVNHVDLYRVGGSEEARELGLEERQSEMLTLVEWPDRANGLFRDDHLEITLHEALSGNARLATVAGSGRWREVLPRMAKLRGFLESAGWGSAHRHFLQGDASSRRYERLSHPDGRSAVLMDMPPRPDGPPVRDGLPYSKIAHLAEGVRPFAAIGSLLRSQGLSAPAVYDMDLDEGFLLLEDLGDSVYSQISAEKFDMSAPMTAAVDVLLSLASARIPDRISLPDGSEFAIPPYDRRAREIEVELLLDWYFPTVKGHAASGELRTSFLTGWRKLWPAVELDEPTLVLRDYHSPNLLWLPQREGLARVGIIDYQDAMIGHAAYDLVSLLQDARIDVSAATETDLLDYYLAGRQTSRDDFDAERFLTAYAIMGAQRAAKILGIFTRLSKRDGKHGYLRHMPRIRRYLARNLRHQNLNELRHWFEHHLPEALIEASS
ncbi:hypothetical protein FHS85_000271 [Rhodoligotrophos appendicifer]|uniref:tRNA (adenosine(37)-N6)-threonylcarbamoyltransferase complex ATPase subunit type 1 TsaE n=1 Tax=Rhodoligotrophos appendicifer TaxID=987056 RepID=UPI00117ED4BB|nr:tRNA (adenosine(37)-N6)-threonylcarbamoyltransferase complex ATPase subunit type 1 TsaE [Rhodoligotrophos appendicifer]